MSLIRLNKLLSHAGIASRRAAEDLIRQGRIELNGHIVTELGTKADPERDDVRVDGRRLGRAPERRYLLMYKPRGIVSTRTDPQRRTTVINLLAAAGINGYFYPVGRLDAESEGLILLTNDGDFAERVTHPRYELERTYEAQVEGVPEERDLERLRKGVTIEGRRTLPAKVRLLRHVGGRGSAQAVIELTIREGRNRQVRRMCDAIAHPVDRLRRTRIGPISGGALRPGQIRDLTQAEIQALTKTDPGRRFSQESGKPTPGIGSRRHVSAPRRERRPRN